MPFPLIPLAIGAGAGLLKSWAVDGPRNERQKQQRAAEIRYSPWTGIAPTTQVQGVDPLGNAIQGGTTGAMLGQSAATADAQDEYLQNMKGNQALDRLSTTRLPASMDAPWGRMGMGGYPTA